jgi:hypothetical protein
MRLLESNFFRPNIQAMNNIQKDCFPRSFKSPPHPQGWGYRNQDRLRGLNIPLAYEGRLRSCSPTLQGAGSISCLLFLNLTTTPVLAHKVQVAEDIGGTLHIEPNDTPRAGESSLTWFALTRQGGKVLSLEECNCKLSIYSATSNTGSSPILSPTLKPVSAERYQGIPGTEIQFPQPGAYQLQLSGTPKIAGDFNPFELKFEVTVAAGTPSSTASSEISLSKIEPTKQEISWKFPLIVVLAILGLVVLWGVVRKRRK